MIKKFLKILEILAVPVNYGGIEAFVRQLLETYDCEADIDCMTPFDCNNVDLIEQLKNRGGSFYELKLPMTVSKKNIISPIRSFLREHVYDIVHIHSSEVLTMSIIAKAADQNKKTSVIVHSHATGSKFTFAMHVFRNLASLSLRKHVDYYCACSVEAAKWKYTPKYQKQTQIIHNGIKTERFRFDYGKRMDIRRKYNIPESEFVVGNVGRLCEAKNQSFLISVFSEIYNSRKDAWLMLVGDGPDRKELEMLAKYTEGFDHIIFVGNTIDVPDYLFSMDVFAFPSKREAFGLAAVEAQASGLPVIASDRVSDEVRLSNEVRFLPLGDNMSEWADTILSMSAGDRIKGVEVVKNAGYDIQYTVEQLKQLYHLSPF